MDQKSFDEAIKGFVHGWIAGENAKRWRAETERRLEAEIRWCREQLDRRLSDRHRATIEHQIRHKELTITFLDYSEKK